MDEHACYQKLRAILHPHGLHCPRCHAPDGFRVHRRRRDPVLDYRYGRCARVFNAFTATPLQGTPRRPAAILLILRGIIQGAPTARLARELACDRKHLLRLRHKIQDRARAGAEAELRRRPLPDRQVEADEVYQNAGEKRRPAPRPGRPAAAARQ